MTTNRVKRQHFVPVSYLRRFVNGQGKLWVFDAERKAHFGTKPENVACEGNFYEPPPPLQAAITGFSQNDLEKAWANAEGPANLLLDKVLGDVEERMVDGKALTFSPVDRLALSMLMTMQMLRTRRTRDFIADDHMAANPDEPLSESAEFLLHRNWEKEGLPMIVVPLFKMTWSIGRATGQIDLITSDSPVVNRIAPTGPRIGWLGITTPKARIAFPLTPNTVLLCYGAEASELKVLSEGKIFELPIEEVADLNITQLLQCHRQVYSRDSLSGCEYLEGFSRFTESV